MDGLYGALSVAAIILSSFLITRIARPSDAVEFVLFCFSVLTGHILAIGYFLSSVNSLDRLAYWSVLSVLVLLSVLTVVLLNKNVRQISFRRVSVPSIFLFKDWYLELSRPDRVLLAPLLLTVISLGFVNLLVVVFSAPHNWDSMSYHLARVAYYIQHGNLNYFDANFAAQVIHAKSSAVLILYTFLVTARNENLTQLVQFISYWVAVFSVYGISRRIGCGKRSSLFSSLVFALLIECLMQSTTTQNDMLITAYIGSVVYFFLAFKETHNRKYLTFAGVSTGLAVGVKSSTFLIFPPLLIVAMYALTFRSDNSYRRVIGNLTVFLISLLLAISVFAVPSGYLANYLTFGHPIAPEDVAGVEGRIRENLSYEGKSINYIVIDGSKNVLRFGLEFLSLDGLPPAGPMLKLQSLIRFLPVKVVRLLGIDLNAESFGIPFYYEKIPWAHEDFSYWGVLGFGLIWIVVLLMAVGIIKSPAGRILAIATVLFLLVQSYVGPYDAWRGRYFVTAAVFAAPTVGYCLKNKRNKLLSAYLTGIVIAGCLSAFSAVAFRVNSAIFPIRYRSALMESIFTFESVFRLDRLGQLTRNRPRYYEPLKRYEELVSKDAVVAVYLGPHQYEYPLFGKKLTRTIIPINSFWKGIQPVPENADYLLYSWRYPDSDASDIHLGADWYLRDLKGNP